MDHREELTRRLSDVIADVMSRRRAGEQLSDEQVIAEHADLMPQLARELAKVNRIDNARRAADVHTATGISALPPSGTDAGNADVSHMVIAGYQVQREIRRGGQAVVYEAVHARTGQRVAIKIMLEGPFASARDKARFEREVKLLAALDHPNVVRIIDSGTAQDGSSYFVMNLIDGRPLDQYLGWDGTSITGAGDPAAVLRLFLQICDAVNAAHLRGIIHRDLKPSNILVDGHGQSHVLDFGLARTALSQMTEESVPQAVTLSGQFIGSLPWASPEQAEGIASRIDTRTDVYSLGVILYQMLTGGAFPYEVAGTMHDVLHNIVTAAPTPPSAVLAAKQVKQEHRKRRFLKTHPPAVNPAMEAIVLKALSKRRDDRYQHAGELAADVGNYISGRPTVAGGKPAGGGWKKVAVGVAAFIAIAAGVGVWWTGAGGGASGGGTGGRVGVAGAVAVVPRVQDMPVGIAPAAREKAAVVASSGGGKSGSADQVRRHLQLRPSGHHIYCMAFSPDGKMLVTGERDGHLRLWDPDSGKAIGLWQAAGIPRNMSFSADATRLSVAIQDEGVRSFEVPGGRTIASIKEYAAASYFSTWSPDGRFVAVAYHNSMCLWDGVGQAWAHKLSGGTGKIYAGCFSPDSSRLAAVDSDGKVFVWNIQTASLERAVRVPDRYATWVTYSPTDDLLAIGCTQGTVGLWRPATQEEPLYWKAHEGATFVAFSPDGRVLATGSFDKAIHLWRIPADDTLPVPLGAPLQSNPPTMIRCITFSPDRRFLAVGHAEGFITLWQLPPEFGDVASVK